MDIPIKDFEGMPNKKTFFTKEILQEWNSLKGGHEIQLQRGSKGKVLGGFKIYGWEPAIMLKFKYLSKNGSRIKKKQEFWDSDIWHENKQLSDTDILNPAIYKFDKPFRILSKVESKKAGQNKMVRDIEAGIKNKEACKEQLKQAKKKQCGRFRSWNKDKVCETPQCTKKERYAFQTGKPNIANEEEGKDAAATAIQSVVRGRSVRNKNNNNKNELPNGSCKGTGKKCGEVDLRIRGKQMTNIGRQAICKSYPNCDWIKTGGRKKKKKKRRKAFPSRRKNNRKNRTKKKALSK
tara:strand:+ start:1629 stop:2507 length:879 start_codon:yes stop_codon:yes gene_type:complete